MEVLLRLQRVVAEGEALPCNQVALVGAGADVAVDVVDFVAKLVKVLVRPAKSSKVWSKCTRPSDLLSRPAQGIALNNMQSHVQHARALVKYRDNSVLPAKW